MSPTRYKLVELIQWTTSEMEFIIPVPDSSANIDAIVKPFQWTVVIAMLEVMFIYVQLVVLTDVFRSKITQIIISE